MENKFWEYFKEICKIPRESGNEENIANYIVNFAKERNLEYHKDSLNNVIVYKKATDTERENETICLQGHIDMVCQKAKGSNHDFEKDPIEIVVEENIVKAKDTTLGADNGIGLSYILTILDSNEIKHPNLECIFTVEEETTMKGALSLDYTKIKSKRIISIDNEEEDKISIGSMGIREYWAEKNVEYTSIFNKENFTAFTLEFFNFKGGHSGIDIGDKERVNPIKLFADSFKNLEIYIENLECGSRPNAIPVECKIDFVVANKDIDKLNNIISDLKSKEIHGNVSIEEKELPEKAITKENSLEILNVVNEYKNGVLASEDGKPLLTSNFAILKKEEDKVKIVVSFRNSVVNLAKEYTNYVKRIFNAYNFTLFYIDEYPAYEAKETNHLISTAVEIYEKMYGKKIVPAPVNGALECGAFSDKIDNLEFIAVGPNIYNAHSIDEYVEIDSANKMYNYVVNLIENI